METSGSYTLKLAMHKVLNAKNKQRYVSPIFSIAHLDYKIAVYPNGNSEKRIGSFDAFLFLEKMPAKWEYVIIQQTIHSPQTHSKITTLEKHARGTGGRGWIANGLSLYELQQITSTEFIITVTVQIFRIKKENQNHIFYEHPLTVNPQHRTQAKWVITDALMEQIETLETCGKTMASDVFDGLWVIGLYPTGENQKFENRSTIAIKLCSLPYGVSKICAGYTISFIELNKRRTRAENEYVVGKSGGKIEPMCSFEEFISGTQVTIALDLTITKMYDHSNKLIYEYDATQVTDEIWDNYVNSADTNHNKTKQSNSLQNIENNNEDNALLEVQFKSFQDYVNNKINSLVQSGKEKDDQIKKLNDRLDSLSNTTNEVIVQISEMLPSEQKNEDSVALKEINKIKQEIKKINKKINSYHMGNDTLYNFLSENDELLQYYDAFIENEFETIESLYNLSNDDLKDLEINKSAHRKLILKLIKEYKQKI